MGIIVKQFNLFFSVFFSQGKSFEVLKVLFGSGKSGVMRYVGAAGLYRVPPSTTIAPCALV